MTFASNYDGAVEAYNDDFVDQVWVGPQRTLATRRLPATRWAFWGGAMHEEQFRTRWRIHQAPVPGWYTAYPALSAVNTRNHARSRAGLRGR